MLAFVAFAGAAAQVPSLNEGQIDYRFAPPVKFSPGGDSARIRFGADGKIYAAARFEAGLGAATPIYRFLPNGQRDATFNGPVVRINDFQLLPDGKILFSDVYTLDSYQMARIRRLNQDGSIDATFDTDVLIAGEILSILPLSDGKILISGSLTEKVENGFVKYVARLNSDGSVDRSFGGDSAARGGSMLVQNDGRIVIVRNASLVRIFADGTPDESFAPYSVPFFGTINLFNAPGGKIVFHSANGGQIVRLNNDGTVDGAFQPQVSGSIGTVAVESDGEILAGRGTTTRMIFERLGQNGNLIARFTSFVNFGLIALSPTDEIYLSTDLNLNGAQRGIIKLHKKQRLTHRRALDFDADGKADFAIYRPSEGNWYILNSASGALSVVRFGAAGDKPVPADYDGDGRADVAVYRPSTGVWYRLFSSTGGFDAVSFGLSTDIPTPNDYDGDDRDDISVFRPSDGIWYRLNSGDGSFGAFQFGLSGDKPQAGDYDGDGVGDFSVYRPSDSRWYVRSSIDGSYKVSLVGYYDGDLGTPVDFDGDNRNDLVYFQDFTGSWYGARSASGIGIYLRWGSTGDVPVPNDYDGDGRDDFGVWRPASGDWWIINSSTGAAFSYRFGLPGDIPVQSAYVN